MSASSWAPGRIALGVAGGVGAAYGAWRLLARGLDDPGDLVDAVLWLAAGVVLHDGVIAPLAILTGLVLVRVVPSLARGPVVVAAVLIVSVSLVAVPVLGRFGARPDNPTLLDRDYTAGWGLIVAVVGLVAAMTLVVRRSGGDRHGPRAGGR